MIEHAVDIQTSIYALKKSLASELSRLAATGHARHVHWSDKYGCYSTWLLSDDIMLLADIEVDGWICADRNPLVRQSTGEILASDDPRIVEVTCATQ